MEQLLVELDTCPRPVRGVTLLSHQPHSISQHTSGAPTFIVGMVLFEGQPLLARPGRLEGAGVHYPHFLPRISLILPSPLIDSDLKL